LTRHFEVGKRGRGDRVRGVFKAREDLQWSVRKSTGDLLTKLLVIDS
jgi:hypothetical protein